MRIRALIAAGVVCVLALVALGAYWPFARANVLVLPGIVEIQEVRLGSKLGGRVEQVKVEEGRVVKPGAVLVVFEAPELEAQRNGQQARVEAAEAEYQRAANGARVEERDAARAAEASALARLERSKEGWRVEEKQMTSDELRAAESDFEQARKDLERIERLMETRAASRSEYDLALAARDRLRSRLSMARARMAMYTAGSRKEDIAEAEAEWKKAKAYREQLDNGTRPEDVKMARAKADEARAKLEEIEANLREANVKVPAELGSALVEVVSVRPGDLVPPNQPVVRVLRADDLWVKVFVPETQLGKVRLDQGVEVQVQIDSYPNRRFKGVVMQRASISEFTPRNVQSVDERRYQVFGVKIRVEDPQGVLNAGMAAEVTIPLE